MPCAQNPAATNRPCTSLSPSTNSLSGVKPSGPLTTRDDVGVSAAGTRRMAFSISGAKRSQSSGSSRLLKSAGRRGATTAPDRARSRRARGRRPPAEVHEVVGVAQLRQVAVSRRRSAFVIRYWCAIGTIGTLTPASARPRACTSRTRGRRARPRSSRSPSRSTSTPVTRPSRTTRSVTRCSPTRPDAAPARPAEERVREAARIEIAVGRQPDRAEHAVGVHQREPVVRLAAPTPAPSADRTSSPSRAGGAAPPCAPGVDAIRSDPTSRHRVDAGLRPARAAGTRRRCASSSASAAGSTGAGRRGRPSGTCSRRRLGAVDDDHVGAAALGEVPRDRRPGHAGADDDRPCVLRHRPGSSAAPSANRSRATGVAERPASRQSSPSRRPSRSVSSMTPQRDQELGSAAEVASREVAEPAPPVPTTISGIPRAGRPCRRGPAGRTARSRGRGR